MLELRHLRAFVVVAEELHFSRAAQRLGISQPPLSQQIRQLERQLGVALFWRDTTGVRLTDAGRILRRTARRILADADGMQRLATDIERGNIGTLRIGFVGSALYGRLPALVRALRACVTAVDIVLEEIETGDQIEALLDFRIDVGVLRPPIHARGLRHRHVAEEPLLAALPADHPLAGQDSINLEQLRDDGFVLFPRQLGTGLWDLTVNSCTAAGFNPNIVREVEHIHTMVGMVACGIGVALVPASVRKLRLPHVTYAQLSPNTANTMLSIAWHSDNESPTLKRFLETTSEFSSIRDIERD